MCTTPPIGNRCQGRTAIGSVSRPTTLTATWSAGAGVQRRFAPGYPAIVRGRCVDCASAAARALRQLLTALKRDLPAEKQQHCPPKDRVRSSCCCDFSALDRDHSLRHDVTGKQERAEGDDHEAAPTSMPR